MRFIDIARPLNEQGIAIIPCKSNSKDPAMVLHGALDASLDPAQIEAWDQQQPGNNCGAVAQPDGCWFLDLDDVKAFLTATGRDHLPVTYSVRTRRGLHLYFRQNDRSRAMGNVKVPAIGEARCLNQYVVAAGSTHPSGQPYEVAVDAPIIEAPDGLIDYLQGLKASTPVRDYIPGVPNEAAVADRLRWLDQWTATYNVEVLETASRTRGGAGRGRKICVTCPRKQMHSSDSGPTESVILIGPDGTLSYRCQHNHCDDLNWAKFRAAFEPAMTPERLALLTGVVAGPDGKVPRPDGKVGSRSHGLPMFDRACLYGRLGEIALMLGVPLGMGFLDLITCFGVLVPFTPGVRTNLYTLNLGPVEGFKGESAKRAMRATKVLAKKSVIASDRGLQKMLAKVAGGPVLVYQGELLAMMRKMTIIGSALPPVLNEYWSDDDGGTADKVADDQVKARLTLLGNLPVPRQSSFKTIFSADTTLGLYDRALFACADPGEVTEFIDPEDLGLDDIPLIVPAKVRRQPHLTARINAWVSDRKQEFPALPRQGRLGEMIIRIAAILSSASGEGEVSDGAFEAASILCYKQCQTRLYYQPSEAIDIGARIYEFFREHLRSQDGFAVTRESLLYEAREALQCGPDVILRIFNASIATGMFRHDRDLDTCFLPGAQ